MRRTTRCKQCGGIWKLPEKATAGTHTRCPKCGMQLVVAAPSASSESSMSGLADAGPAPPLPARPQGPPLHIAITGLLCGLAAGVLLLLSLIQSLRGEPGITQNGWLCLALISALGIYGAIQFYIGRSTKYLMLALSLGVLVDLASLIALPIYQAYFEDRERVVINREPINPGADVPPDQEDVEIKPVVERLDHQKINMGLTMIGVYVALSVYLMSPSVKRYFDRSEAPRYTDVLTATEPEGSTEPSEVVTTGALGSVYKASDSQLRREVALKDLTTEEDHDRFVRDATSAAQLRHPELVQPRTIRRHTDVSFPAMVQAGKVYNLRIQLVPAEYALPSGEVHERPRPHEHDTTLDLTIPPPTGPGTPPPPVKLTISVAAENFEIEGPGRAELIVPLTGKSPAVQFGLRGLDIGPGRIMVDFAQDGRPVGSVDPTPEVTDLDTPRPPGGLASTSGELSLILGLDMAPTPPDVVLKVFEHRLPGHPGRLQFVLASSHPALADLPVLDGDLGTLNLRTDTAGWVDGQLHAIGALAEGAEDDDVTGTLAAVGYNLYQHLLPPAVQELSWTLRRRGVKTLMILSDDPHIPWELIKPFRADPITGAIIAEDGYWGESYALAHWLRGRPPVPRLSITRVLGVAAILGEFPQKIPPPAEELSSGSRMPTTRDMVRSDSPTTWTDIPAGPAASGFDQPGPVSLVEQPLLGPGVIPLTPIHGPGGSRTDSGPLAVMDEELGLLRAFEALGARVERLPALRRAVRQAFEQGSFDLLHLVSHGSFGGAAAGDASAVSLEDGLFTAAELSQRMAGALRRTAPLVFFNTCHCGRIGYSLTCLGSWGAHLMRLGCGGFVGALWPVSDRAALAFARAFYEQLVQKCPLGEAVRLARLRVREQYPGDPTWLAFRCFADPMARVEPGRAADPP